MLVGSVPKVLHPDVDVLEELLDVGHVRVGLDDVCERRAGGGERGLDVLAHLAQLCPHVARADHVAFPVAGELT